MEIAVENGKQNKKIKLGICGEHGGDPKSIIFVQKVWITIYLVLPYRVPVARLAAAQAELKLKNNYLIIRSLLNLVNTMRNFHH